MVAWIPLLALVGAGGVGIAGASAISDRAEEAVQGTIEDVGEGIGNGIGILIPSAIKGIASGVAAGREVIRGDEAVIVGALTTAVLLYIGVKAAISQAVQR